MMTWHGGLSSRKGSKEGLILHKAQQEMLPTMEAPSSYTESYLITLP